MYQTPSQCAQGLKSEPSQPVKTSARSGKRQPTGRPWTPMRSAASEGDGEDEDAAADGGDEGPRERAASPPSAGGDRRLGVRRRGRRRLRRRGSPPRLRAVAGARREVSRRHRPSSAADEAVADEAAEEGGAQVAGELAPPQRVGGPGVQPQAHAAAADVGDLDAVLLALRRRRERFADLEHRLARRARRRRRAAARGRRSPCCPASPSSSCGRPSSRTPRWGSRRGGRRRVRM